MGNVSINLNNYHISKKKGKNYIPLLVSYLEQQDNKKTSHLNKINTKTSKMKIFPYKKEVEIVRYDYLQFANLIILYLD